MSRNKVKPGQRYRRVRDSFYRVSEGRRNFTIVKSLDKDWGGTWGVRYDNGDMGEVSSFSISMDFVLEGGDEDRFLKLKDRLVRVVGESGAKMGDKSVMISLDEWEHLISLVEAADKS